MNRSHRLTKKAEADLDDAYWWYEQQSFGRGDDFLREFKSRVSEIDATPYQFPLVSRILRAAMMVHSNFIIYYRIELSEIVIAAVQHANANPRKWKRRK